jgi:hypothetical protein
MHGVDLSRVSDGREGLWWNYRHRSQLMGEGELEQILPHLTLSSLEIPRTREFGRERKSKILFWVSLAMSSG